MIADSRVETYVKNESTEGEISEVELLCELGRHYIRDRAGLSARLVLLAKVPRNDVLGMWCMIYRERGSDVGCITRVRRDGDLEVQLLDGGYLVVSGEYKNVYVMKRGG